MAHPDAIATYTPEKRAAMNKWDKFVTAAKPMVGFGDPVFDPAERAIALAARARLAKQAAKSRPTATRAYSDFWQGAGADRAELALGLPSLLDTADELKAVAAKLGAPAADIQLEKDASETTVKRTALADYRVVYFATHGLVAGDVKGLGEPSLALTLPAQPLWRRRIRDFAAAGNIGGSGWTGGIESRIGGLSNWGEGLSCLMGFGCKIGAGRVIRQYGCSCWTNHDEAVVRDSVHEASQAPVSLSAVCRGVS
jgi:hypothetical protein